MLRKTLFVHLRGKNLGFKRKKRGEIGIAMQRVRTQKEGDDREEYLKMSKKRNKGDDKKSLSLPLDLIIEILTRMPPKSVSKLICVSKLWLSIIQSKHFTELYLARSSTRPRLVFKFFCDRDKPFFHSAFQDDPSSDHRAITSPILDPLTEILPPIRGLICCRNRCNLAICNPSTSQFLTLPEVSTYEQYKDIFFGYDPVNDLYKVLSMTVHRYCGAPPVVSEEHQVFTLGAQKSEWRMIECKHPHYPATTQGLCINGVLYYGAWPDHCRKRSLLVSFDLRFEEFSLIALPEDSDIKYSYDTRLVSFSGKIALVDHPRPFTGKFESWVLEDVSKQEWSKFSVLVHSWKDLARNELYRCLGSISTGELVFIPRSSTTEVFVICYDPKEDKARRVEFQKTRDKSVLSNTFILDLVESPMFLPR